MDAKTVSELPWISKTMRDAGVRRLVLDGDHVVEVELADTIPAPPPELEPLPDDQPEPKMPNQCIYPNCALDNGWQFDSRYCRTHGLKVSGVKP